MPQTDRQRLTDRQTGNTTPNDSAKDLSFTVSKLLQILLLVFFLYIYICIHEFFLGCSGHWTYRARQELEGHWHLPAGYSGGALPHRSIYCAAVKRQVLLQTPLKRKRWSALHQFVSFPPELQSRPVHLRDQLVSFYSAALEAKERLLMPISCLVGSNHRPLPFPVCLDPVVIVGIFLFFLLTISAQFGAVQVQKEQIRASGWCGHPWFCFVYPVDNDGKRSGSPLTLNDLFDRNFQVHDPGAKWINGKQKKNLYYKCKNGGCSVLIAWSKNPKNDSEVSDMTLFWLFKYKSILLWPWRWFSSFLPQMKSWSFAVLTGTFWKSTHAATRPRSWWKTQRL